MPFLIRSAMYLLSGYTIWQFVQPASLPNTNSFLALNQAQGLVLGVCAGLGNYINIDVSLIRLLFVVFSFYRGLGIILYIALFLILPVQPA